MDLEFRVYSSQRKVLDCFICCSLTAEGLLIAGAGWDRAGQGGALQLEGSVPAPLPLNVLEWFFLSSSSTEEETPVLLGVPQRADLRPQTPKRLISDPQRADLRPPEPRKG